jgi:hypothetical protein
MAVSGGTITTLTTTSGISVQGLTVGRGAGAGSTNTAVGASALQANTTGAYNTAVGYQAGYTNSTSSWNTGLGWGTLYTNTGGGNTAIGGAALYGNTTGSNNVAIGTTLSGNATLQANTTGSYNTAVGNSALASNTTASNNTAMGYQAGYTNTLSGTNTFLGIAAGYTHNLGSAGNAYNTFVGAFTGYSVTTGAGNTFIGTLGSAGNAGCGYYMTTGSNNTIIGGYTGNQNGLDIRTASNYIVLSDGAGNPRGYWDATNWNFPPMYSQTTGEAVNLNVNSSGAVRRSTSSLRYKNTVNDATHGLTELLTLRPVTYKGNNDGDTVFGGLIAEEVHEAGLTEFVQLDAEGRPDALAYGNMVSLCIKAIQELKAEFDAYKEAHP